ncbi:UNVERIFIED_CONTAM: putative ribonuclease H protein [Sesamum calycinum]|uniref:Ribonuclease H protein n=1 Tax=Sesamum calycinum TaxID=2727403 RepID=A0AAW2JUC7_9LAMI
MLKGGDQCSKAFFRRVATRRANKRLFQISDSDGLVQTNPTTISSVFVTYFQDLLGGDRTDRALDLHYLRPWARHILTEEEACALIRPVTVDDVKTAMFDIEEDKAPGPDGFSSGFYKAAWPMGKEISKAIKDFFTTGRLLKQVNATLLTLIPKVRTPHSVADFRPISCCNVITKLFPRFLCAGFEKFLDLLISPSQNAFIPGRLISDNVLLAQELFSGYNQCRLPPRCALKVDLRKAYDTVEWDFLFATLRLFGFPAVFISELKLFQLSFADDLLLLCKADVRSVSLFRRGLDVFASLSGLHTNPQKSQLIFSKAASGLRDSLLETLGFQEGHLPVRYLGLPLISARLSIADCQPLLQKIDSRIKGWEGVQLSFAGRVQLIKSVLVSLEVYWAMAFILPKGIINEMIKRLRTFLWKGTSSSGYPKVAWEVVCRPIEEGGQGIKDIFALNRALMSKHLWAVIQQDRTSIWVDWIFQTYVVVSYPISGGGWYFSYFGMIRGIHWDLSSLDSPGTSDDNTGPLDKISVVMEDRQWNWPMITDIACLEITYMLPPISEGQDRISWKSNNGSFNTSTAYDLFRPPGPKVVWSSLLLGPFKIPKNCFILWLAIMGRLSTLDKPWLQNTDSNCILCPDGVPETHNHLFFTCSFSHRCLTIIRQQIPFLWPTVTGNEEFTGRHPDGEESTWLMQHFDLYLPH